MQAFVKSTPTGPSRESESGKFSKVNSKKEIRRTRVEWRIATSPTFTSALCFHGRTWRNRLVTTRKWRRPLSACLSLLMERLANIRREKAGSFGAQLTKLRVRNEPAKFP